MYTSRTPLTDADIPIESISRAPHAFENSSQISTQSNEETSKSKAVPKTEEKYPIEKKVHSLHQEAI